MSIRVILTPEAQTDMQRLDSATQRRILDKLAWIGENAALLRHEALRGEEWHGCFRYRLADYRIIYQVDWDMGRLFVLKVGHRRDIYR
jgi:mRNA interferase RelE/StbE